MNETTIQQTVNIISISDKVLTVSKLSKLQKWILKRALDKPDRPNNNSSSGCDMITARVMNEYFHIKLRSDDYRNEEYRGKVQYASWNFTKEQISKKLSNSHKASISRAFRRLEQRKLVERIEGNARWSGINLTEQGKETVNTNLLLAKY